MGDADGRSADGRGTEELILSTIAAHADSLLRTARRHSICLDDAQDAYQRSLEIFMRHADRLDAARAGAWLHTVVKREAQAIRRSRHKHVGASDTDLDAHESNAVTPEERLLSFDMVSRSAEALQRLKPQELRALWLKAQGHSYSEIGAITGWSYTKVNRCLSEGRRSFLERYAGIESGDECDRWLPVLSAIVDGEATRDQLLELRPHLRNCPSCRGRLKALRDSSEPLAAVLPVPLAAAAIGSSDHVSTFLVRLYESVAGGLHERAITTVTKAQSLLEASAAGKVAAVAASTAAVAGGGYATAERSVEHAHEDAHRVSRISKPSSTAAIQTRPWNAPAKAQRIRPHISRPDRRQYEFAPEPTLVSQAAPEFASRETHTRGTTEDAGTQQISAPSAQGRAPAPEFRAPTTTAASPEFSP